MFRNKQRNNRHKKSVSMVAIHTVLLQKPRTSALVGSGVQPKEPGVELLYNQ